MQEYVKKTKKFIRIGIMFLNDIRQRRLPFVLFRVLEEFTRLEEFLVDDLRLLLFVLTSQPHFSFSQEQGAIKRDFETKHT